MCHKTLERHCFITCFYKISAIKTYSCSVMSFWLFADFEQVCHHYNSFFVCYHWIYICSMVVVYKLKLHNHVFSACWLLTFSRSLLNVVYICSALDSSNWIKICLDSSSRIIESHHLMFLWFFYWWLWVSLCPVSQDCPKILFCSFGMFEFFLRSTLFCFSFEYCWLSSLRIHSNCTLSIWANPAKFKQF